MIFLRRLVTFATGIFLGAFVVWGVAQAAGSLTAPVGTPVAQSYTLDDIYTKLTTNADATEGDHNLTTADAPSEIFHSLSEIYAAIPTIDASKILSGTTYLGVAGSIAVKSGNTTAASSSAQGTSLVFTIPQGYYSGASSVTVSTTSSAFAAGNIKSGVYLFGVTGSYGGSSSLANMWNGTSGSFTGGSISSGGVDDYNNGQAAPSDRFSSTWTTCDAGNSYCGTGDSGAQVQDTNSGLIWSYPCNVSGCASFSASSPLTYTWDNSGGNNGSKTASQLWSSHSGWFLPNQKMSMQAYIDGAEGNMESNAVHRAYWTGTIVSDNTGNAWYVYLGYGFTNNSGKGGGLYIRCIHS